MKKQRHLNQAPKRNNRKKSARPATPKVRRRAHQRPTQKSTGSAQWVAVLHIIAQLMIAVLSFTAHHTKADTPPVAPIANWHIVSTSASTYRKTPPLGGAFKIADTTFGAGIPDTQIADERDGAKEQAYSNPISSFSFSFSPSKNFRPFATQASRRSA